MSQSTYQQVADLLDQAGRAAQPIAPVRTLLPENDIAAAYAVQKFNTERAVAQGRRLTGRKVGLTSVSVQKQLGVDQPDFGMLFADMAFADGQEIPWSRVLQPKCEAEVALVLASDLDGIDVTIPDLIEATAYLLPAIEIVGSRIANWDIRIVDTIADNASSGLYVLGNQPVALADVDLRLAGMVLERNGEPVSFGVGAACLGHPFNAALWLARKLSEVGMPLRAGDVVLSGALGPMVVAKAGDVFEARIAGLGSVRAVFGEQSAEVQ